MTLRLATDRDVAALATLHAAAGFDPPWRAEDLQTLLAGHGAVAVLAPGEREPEGFILIQTVAGESEVLTLAVAPPARRRGVASALLAAAIAAAKGEGAEAMLLEVADDNAAALALYAAFGFSEAGRRPGYYARPGGAVADARILRLDLNTAPFAGY